MLPKILSVVRLLLSALSAGCAGTAPEAKFTQPMSADARIQAADTETVALTAADTVQATPEERERVKQKITARIDARERTNPQEGAARAFAVEVFVSRYARGNAFARFMLAGTGQIHIDGTISVHQMPGHERPLNARLPGRA